MRKTVYSLFILLTVTLFGGSAENEFFRACLAGDYNKVLELYEKEGIRLTYARDKDGNTPLHLACCSKKGGNKQEIVRFLLDKGVNVNAYNQYESTPLTIAVSNGNYEATKLLLGVKGIRVNQGYQQNFTPLHLAVVSQAIPLIHLLLSHPETNPNFGTSDGATPLHYAAMQGLIEEAKILIDDPRTNINAPQHDPIYAGATPLHFAAMQAQTEIVAHLLSKKGIDVHATLTQGTHKGFTPLHFAVLNPDTVNVFEVVKLLTESGADPKFKCEAGKAPLDLTAVSIIQDALKNHKKKKK
ncbi:MAG: ankyrin repeat domain-containing protein [Chlamydiia bacterium]|nr:ankyrin repeat domain-containing protein [Chlamydiia bacterium]